MKIRYTRRALGDLVSIHKYLSTRNPRAANSVKESIRQTVRLLREFPGSGRQMRLRRDVRVFPLSDYPYLIFYAVTSEEFRVLHVRHGARRPPDPDEF